MSIAIICTGTELLKGSCCNTDLAFAGSHLTAAGMPPVLELTVGDHRDELIFALGTALKSADNILISGGLGPTGDDITLETVACFFGLNLSIDPVLKEKVEKFWALRHTGRCPKFQYKQAMLPDGARYFDNPAGVASGIGFDLVYAGQMRHIYLLPGPPGEFETVFSTGILPELCSRRETQLFTVGCFICGIGETLVARTVEPLLKSLPLEIAYTAQSGGTKLFLSGSDELMVSAALEQCRHAIGSAALPAGCFSLPEYVIAQLTARGETIACAESCTGGLVADALVSVPGASACFPGGIAAYANEVKENLLRVPSETLASVGAVSAECAEAMASGAAAVFNSDGAVSTTGIAGPGGGTPQKPVGLVYVAASYHGTTAVRELHLRGNRRMIRERAVAQALLLFKELLDGCGADVC
ncbi:MAG: nicotinamide-nucleotide amidohydrolase family protein [Lentisphaeria bacterium]|nr:nicotinamide-nucleotide amidohydrolase family protein [Lentisphaeria bacterium]